MFQHSEFHFIWKLKLLREIWCRHITKKKDIILDHVFLEKLQLFRILKWLNIGMIFTLVQIHNRFQSLSIQVLNNAGYPYPRVQLKNAPDLINLDSNKVKHTSVHQFNKHCHIRTEISKAQSTLTESASEIQHSVQKTPCNLLVSKTQQEYWH